MTASSLCQLPSPICHPVDLTGTLSLCYLVMLPPHHHHLGTECCNCMRLCCRCSFCTLLLHLLPCALSQLENCRAKLGEKEDWGLYHRLWTGHWQHTYNADSLKFLLRSRREWPSLVCVCVCVCLCACFIQWLKLKCQLDVHSTRRSQRKRKWWKYTPG